MELRINRVRINRSRPVLSDLPKLKNQCLHHKFNRKQHLRHLEVPDWTKSASATTMCRVSNVPLA